METFALTPDPLPQNGNKKENWIKWRQEFLAFMSSTNFFEKSEDVKCSLLKSLIGPAGYHVIENFSSADPENANKLYTLLNMLDSHFSSPPNEVIQRYAFFRKSKNKNQSISEYVDDLKQQAKSCNFGNMTDSLIRDKIILDTKDRVLRNKFFYMDGLDLQKMILIWTNYENDTTKMKEPLQDQKNSVDAVERVEQKNDRTKYKGCCWRCGEKHEIRKCPAWGVKCNKCDQLHHLTGRCRSSAKKSVTEEQNKGQATVKSNVNPINNTSKNTQATYEKSATTRASSVSSMNVTSGVVQPKSATYEKSATTRASSISSRNVTSGVVQPKSATYEKSATTRASSVSSRNVTSGVVQPKSATYEKSATTNQSSASSTYATAHAVRPENIYYTKSPAPQPSYVSSTYATTNVFEKKFCPSAPPLSEFGKPLYPDLSCDQYHPSRQNSQAGDRSSRPKKDSGRQSQNKNNDSCLIS